MAWQGMSWHDMTWLMTCHFMSWHDMTWPATWHDITWHDMSFRVMTWHDMTHDMTWHDMTWQGMSWHDIASFPTISESLLPALMYLTSWYRHIRFSSELSNFCFLWRVRLRRHRQIGMHPNLGKHGHKTHKNEILSTRRPILLSCSRFHWKRANTEGKREAVKLTQIDTG